MVFYVWIGICFCSLVSTVVLFGYWLCFFSAGMASLKAPSLLLRHRLRVEHGNIAYGSLMTKGIVVFVKQPKLVTHLAESGTAVNYEFIKNSLLAVPSTRITLSRVSPFVSNKVLAQEHT